MQTGLEGAVDPLELAGALGTGVDSGVDTKTEGISQIGRFKVSYSR